MPWCPKCKSEYREGFSICADCGSELVDEEQFARLEAEREEKCPASAEAACMAETDGNRPEDAGRLAVKDISMDPEEQRKRPESGGNAFSDKEPGGIFASGQGTAEDGTGKAECDDAGMSENPSESRIMSGRPYTASGGGLYQDNAQRASENRSSAWVLMVVGGLGIVVLILGIAGVIPLHFSNAYLFYGVMAAVFILFVVAGIVSMKNALKFEKRAESENTVKAALLEWCGQNLRAEDLDRQIGIKKSSSMEEGQSVEEDFCVEEASQEILYFKRFEAIKARLNHQFLNLDQGFLEKLIDDTVYEMIYGPDEKMA